MVFFLMHKSAPNKKKKTIRFQPHLKFKLKDLSLHTTTKKNWNWSDFEDEDFWKEKLLDRNLAVFVKDCDVDIAEKGSTNKTVVNCE